MTISAGRNTCHTWLWQSCVLQTQDFHENSIHISHYIEAGRRKLATIFHIISIFILVNENDCISIRISHTFVSNGQINTTLVLSRQQAIFLTNDAVIYWSIDALIGPDE